MHTNAEVDLNEPADCQSRAEHCTDVTVSVHEGHMQVVSSCNAQEEIYVGQEVVPATMNKSGMQIEAEKLSQGIQTPSTVLVWIDGVWSGDSVSYKQLFAGTGRLKNHSIDTPRVSRHRTIAGGRTAIITRILGRAECQSVRLRDTSRIRSIR